MELSGSFTMESKCFGILPEMRPCVPSSLRLVASYQLPGLPDPGRTLKLGGAPDPGGTLECGDAPEPGGTDDYVSAPTTPLRVVEEIIPHHRTVSSDQEQGQRDGDDIQEGATSVETRALNQEAAEGLISLIDPGGSPYNPRAPEGESSRS